MTTPAPRHASGREPTGQRSTRRSTAELTVADAMLTVVKLCDTSATVGDVRLLFASEHIHAAVVVERGILICVIDRAEVTESQPDDAPITRLGALNGRVVSPDLPLEQAWNQMLQGGRRRMAVVADDGRLRGLLCLKRRGSGFCSNSDVFARVGPDQPR